MNPRSTVWCLLVSAAVACSCACSSGRTTRRRRTRRPQLTLAREAPYKVAFEAEQGGGDHRLAADVWRVALADLRLCGLFVPGRAPPPPSARSKAKAAAERDDDDDLFGDDPPGGASAGDDTPLALVRIDRAAQRRPDGSRGDGPKWKLRARVYAARAGQRRLLRSLAVDGRRVRRAGHQLANLLYALHTQKRGPFLSRIAFVAPTAGTKGRQVFVVDYSGKGVLRVSRRGRHNILPAWSPRGDLIYTSYQHDNPDLYLLPRGHSRARPIASYRGLNVGGAFSPDGRAIALTLTRTGNSDVHIIDRRGRMLRRLTRHAGIDASPTWSPDGRHIAFVSSRAGRPHVFVVASDGSDEPRQLTRDGYENQEPRWCHEPGSRAIAYTSRGSRGFDVYVTDVRSGVRRRLTDGPGDRKSPSWSPHCRHLVYSAGKSGLWIVAARGGARPRQLYAAPAWTPAWSR